MREVVTFRDVSFAYPGEDRRMIEILHSISLRIEEGKFVSIIGPNGSGKSTLAKHINALLLPVQGVVTVCGIETGDREMVWEIRRRAGMVFQNPDNQLVAATVEDDVAFGLENLGFAPEEMRERIDEALALVRLEDFRGREPHRLSGGQKQRVAIAGIIAMKPSVIILDEATSMLDPAGRKEVMDTAKRLNREEGITIINITHFLDETLAADYVIVMHEGRIYLEGSPEQVYREVQRLADIGLEIPFHLQLKNALRAEGLPLPERVFTREELVSELWKLLSKD
ncbi:energy-coupling factor transporter ATPase [Bacillaceae bacterium]